MIIQVTCPSCGSRIEIDNSREFMFCRYCGTKILTGTSYTSADMSADPYEDYGAGANADYAPAADVGFAPVPQYNQPVQQYNAPTAANLTISYSTTTPQYPLTVMIGAEKWVFPDQAIQGFSMAPGVYTVSFFIARRGWRKIINIPPTGVPVRVSVVYAGRTHIYIQ